MNMIDAAEFNPAKFQGLFKTNTLRLVTNWDFCAFGRDEMEKALGLDRSMRPMTDFPPSCQPTHPFWFEIEDAQIEEADGTVTREPSAVWMPNETTAYFIERDAGGQIRCVHINETPNGQGVFSFRLSRMVGALFALHEMPPVITAARTDNEAIPPMLRADSPTSGYALFTSVYLKREYSDAIKKMGDRKTLDIAGRRFHYVRGHWMTPKGAGKPVWRRFHWRGDIELGIARKIFVGKGS